MYFMGAPAGRLGGVKDETRSSKEKISLVDVDLPDSGIVFAVLVFDSRDTQAFAGGLSLPACGGAVGERFCDMVIRLNRIKPGLPQGQETSPAIEGVDGGTLFDCRCAGVMVVSEYHSGISCDGCFYSQRATQQPNGRT